MNQEVEFPWDGTAEPEAVQPEAVQPETVAPEFPAPEFIEPHFIEPMSVEPETVQPETVQPEMVQPETVEPEFVRPEFVQSEAAPAKAASPSQQRNRTIARKEYYSIGEVSDLVGLPAHVLRYWEDQFRVLNPSKNRSGNRAYQRKEIRLILLVKQLLYEDKYTIEGAKTRLEQLRKGGELANAAAGALDKELLGLLRADVASLRQVLTGPGV